jgi:isopentenyl diphosphate isomerase/L-lactate dehydrogenase-like FMN-dependent dehydrogenase
MAPVTYRLGGNEQLISVDDYRRAARRRVPRLVWDFVEGGADDSATVTGNRDAYSRWALRVRAMTGHRERRLQSAIAGAELALPVLLAPAGGLGLAHWRGDVAAARAAEAAGTRLVLSTASSWSIEEVASATRADHCFQLYPGGEHTVSLMQRAWHAGFRALFVTVDVPVMGNREGERRHGYARVGSGMGSRTIVLTPREALDVARHPRWVYELYRHRRSSMRNLLPATGIGAALQSIEMLHREIERATFAWDDLAWIRDQWPGALYVKGLLEAEDARRAVTLGCDGVVVSNHGGRQLDHARASLDALPEIADAVGDRAQVLLDGGVRRGTDVVKALALGADAVLIGRPQIYGLIVGGERGVRDVLAILRAELDRALTLMGVGSTGELDRSWIVRSGDGERQ